MQHWISAPATADPTGVSVTSQEPDILCTQGLVASTTNPRVDRVIDNNSTPAVPEPNEEDGMSETDQPSMDKQADYFSSIDKLKNVQQLCTRLSGSHSLRVELRNDARRWLANFRLIAGRWAEAATQIQSLLDENPRSNEARLCRDLAVAYAHLGRYAEARESLRLAQERMKMADLAKGDAKGKTSLAGEDTPEEQNRLGRKQGMELQINEATMNMAIATVEMLAGDYTTALKTSSDVLDLMKKMLGAKYFRTLAIATLKAWCLVYNGKYVEAETLCLSTYKATPQSLGRFHLQSLAAMRCLVHIFQCQGRFAEAIGTGLSLDSLSTAWMKRPSHIHSVYTEWMKRPSHIHPQAIHSKFLLATAFLASGDYATSKLTIDKAVAHQAELSQGVNNPEILRYKSEQARALLYLGNISKAQDLAYLVAVQQFEFYARSHGITNHCIIDLSARIEVWPHTLRLRRLNNVLTEMLETPISSLLLHPFLVSTLQLLANIEVRKYRLAGRKRGSPDLAAARAILEALHNYYANMECRPIVSASSIALDLATLCKEEMSHPDDLSKAVKLFTQAYEDKKSYQGENIDILCALRELTITQCLLDISTPYDGPVRTTVKAVSHTILKTLQSRLGLAHPETLTSQLWYLTVDHLIPDDDDNSSSSRDKVVEDLIKTLSDPRVVKERLVESLFMKRQLASILKGSGSCEKAAALIDDAISELDGAALSSEHNMSREAIQKLRTTFVELKETADDNGEASK
ncbi:hypothetical protein GGR55DRAFT_591645 [Xylaria sp. FL0064]|nr:hypothetical protein GGR55DRAFT_591645 [Xylaria sp. FL0064]